MQEEVFVDKNKTHTICKATGVCEDWPRIELVYGMPGKFLMTLLSLFYLISQYCCRDWKDTLHS